MHQLRLVVARLSRYYRQPLSEILDLDVDDLEAWAEIIPELEPKR